jgi:putative PEP-CTERM system TPR-repeat lipoprotein
MINRILTGFFLAATSNSRRSRGGFIAVAVAIVLALNGCSDSPERVAERIKAYRAQGDNASAAIEIKSALENYPNNPELFLLAGQVLSDLGDLPNAEQALRRALEYGSPRAGVTPLLARVLLETEQYPEALKVLTPEGKAAPAPDPDLMILRGRAYLGLGSLLEARTEFHVSQNARPSPAAKLGLAQVAMADNDPAAAERLVAEVLEADPKSAAALTQRAEFLRRGGRLDEAAAAYQQAIKLEPDNAVALTELATLEVTRDRLDVAQPLLQRAEKLTPYGPRLRFAKALLAYREKRNPDAIKELGMLLLAIPKHGPGLMLTGMVQYAEGNYELAQIAFVNYLQRFPRDVGARRLLAATLLTKGQPHLAANILAPVIVTTTDVGLLGLAADAYRLMGRFKEARAALERAMKLAPQDPGLLTNLALVDLASGARARAVTGLESAIALAPKDSRADEALIMILLGQNQVDHAEQIATALEKRLPDSPSTHVLRAAVQIVKKDWPRARASLERSLQLDPRNLQAVDALADVDAGEQKQDRRRERIEAILKKDEKHVGALLALARLELADGSHDKGVATIRRALSGHPQSGNALLMLADTQFRRGQTGEAVISARQAHDLHPFDTRAIAILAEAQMAVGDRQGAIVTLTKLTTLQPTMVSGYLRLAAAQVATGDAKGAAATVLAALKSEPQDRGAQALLADIYLAAGDLERAQALGSQVQQEDPKAALGYRIEGEVLLARKDYARALDAFKKAAAIQMNGALLVRMHRAQSAGTGRSAGAGVLRSWVEKNSEDVETRFYLAEVLSGAGSHREAVEQYREILRREPNSARALNDLAWSLHASGDKRALEYARQAVALVPNNAAVVDTLGWILVEQGNVGEGVPALLKAVELNGSVPEIRYHLVQALLRIGDNGRAKKELDTLLRSNKDFPQLAEARLLAAKLK